MRLKTKKTLLYIFTALSAAVGISLGIWRMSIIQAHYDPYHGSFENGSGSLLRAFEYIVVLAALLMLVSLIFIRKTGVKESGRISSVAFIANALCGFTVLTLFILLFAFFSREIFENEGGSVNKIGMVIAIIMLVPMAAFFFAGASFTEKKRVLRASLSLSLPIFAVSYLIGSYFDSAYIFDDFNRIVCHISFCAMLVFFMALVRTELGKDAHIFLYVSSLMCIVALGAYILPMIVLAAFWEMGFSKGLLIETVQLAILVYAIYSAIHTVKSLCEQENVTE